MTTMLRTRTLRRALVSASLASVTALPLAACAQGGGSAGGSASFAKGCKQHYTIGFSHPFSEAQFVKALKKVVADYGPKECAKILLDNTTANNLQTQRETVESWVTQGVNAIVFWPVDPSAYADIVPTAQKKGIKWLTYVGPVKGQNGSVGFNPMQEGDSIAQDVTQWLGKHYPKGGVQAAVTMQTTQPTIKGRWTQPMAALKKLGVPIASKQDCSNQSCGLDIATNVLRENPKVRVFISYNDDVALGTQKAIQNAGLNPDDYYVNGYDGSPEGLANVKQGKGAFRVTMAIPVANLGQDIVKNAIAAITGKGDPNSLTPDIKVTSADSAKIDQLLSVFGK